MAYNLCMYYPTELQNDAKLFCFSTGIFESLRQIHHPTGCEYMEHVLLELVIKDFTAKGSSSPAGFEICEVPIMCWIKCHRVAGLAYARFVVRGVCAHVIVSGWNWPNWER